MTLYLSVKEPEQIGEIATVGGECLAKTEIMFCNFDRFSTFAAIAFDGASFPVCSDLRYIGSLMQSGGILNWTIKHRINIGYIKWR